MVIFGNYPLLRERVEEDRKKLCLAEEKLCSASEKLL